MYGVEMPVRVSGAESSRVAEDFAFRDLKWEIGPRRWSLSVNGRPIFLRGACYATAYQTDELTAEDFNAHVQLARDTNLDALRVIANVLPREFYSVADAAGMLLIQEL